MKSSVLAVSVFALTLAVAACNRSSDSAPEGISGATNDVSDTGAVPAGTSGREDTTQVQQDAVTDDLPDTASPLALIGGVGVLSLAGAAGVRALRRG